MKLESNHCVVPLLHRISDVVQLARVGKTTIYAEIAAGRLKIVKLGRSTLIRDDDLQMWLNGLARVSDKAA